MYFVNSSTAPIVFFRGRLKSVADVLKGIRDKGFTSSRWNALLCYWEAVCRHGPCGPISSFEPWDRWIPPDLHGFFRWVFDSLDLLNDFLQQVVVSRRDLGFISGLGGFGRIWVLGLTLGLNLISFHFPTFLVVKDAQTQSSRILVEPPEFRKAWMHFFCRSGHSVVTSDWSSFA